MKWAKGDLVVTANYKSTFPLMSLLLHWVKCSWLGINTLNLLHSATVPLYYDCSFRYLQNPRPLTTVTEKSWLSVSHKWIQAAFVRLFYGFPNCWHKSGSLLPFINERISAAIQPVSLPTSGGGCKPQSWKLSQLTSLMFLPGTGRQRDISDTTIRGSNLWTYLF
jgi:hypothetical protein